MIDRRFRTDALLGYLAQAVSLGCGFLFMALLTRSAGLTVFGAIVMLGAISGVLANLMTFRTNEAVVAFCKQAEIAGQLGRAKLALLTGTTLDLLVGVALLGLITVLAGPLAARLLDMPDSVGDVRLYGLVLLGQLLRGTAIGMFQAEGRFLAVTIATTLDQTGRLALLAVFAAAGSVTLHQAVLAILVPCAIVSAAAFSAVLVRLTVGMRDVALAGRDALREFLRFSATTFVSSSLKAGNQQVDTLVLGWVAGPAVVGLYGVFRQFLSPLNFVSTPFAAISYPRFIEAIARRNPGAVSTAISRLDRRLAAAYLAMAAVLVPTLVLYLRWADIDVSRSAWAGLALMVFSAVASGRLWWARPFSNATRPSLSLRANLCASVALLSLLWPAAHWLGLPGVAATMATVTAALSVWWRVQLARHLRDA